jgi:hypothetical protein
MLAAQACDACDLGGGTWNDNEIRRMTLTERIGRMRRQ